MGLENQINVKFTKKDVDLLFNSFDNYESVEDYDCDCESICHINKDSSITEEWVYGNGLHFFLNCEIDGYSKKLWINLEDIVVEDYFKEKFYEKRRNYMSLMKEKGRELFQSFIKGD